MIRETSHPDVNMIFGAVIDPDMTDEIRVTVIATGFERTGMPRRITHPTARTADGKPANPALESVSVESHGGQSSSQFRPQTFNTEDLDIPTFLRNHNK